MQLLTEYRHLADNFGWVANILVVIGMILLTKKQRSGFIYNILGHIVYLVQSLMLMMSSLLAIDIILIGVNIFGFLKWKQTKILCSSFQQKIKKHIDLEIDRQLKIRRK